jgi:hypothetical protein
VAAEVDFADLVPITPTARRTVRPTDAVAIFLQIYQGRATTSPVRVTTRITNDRDEVVRTLVEQLEGAPGRDRRTADYLLDLPLADLAAGEYLLTVTVSDGERHADRSLRFTVRSRGSL